MFQPERLPGKPTQPRSIRLTNAEWSQLGEIGKRWGPVVPLSVSDVIREFIRRESISAVPKRGKR